jgi:hypothetical protein
MEGSQAGVLTVEAFLAAMLSAQTWAAFLGGGIGAVVASRAAVSITFKAHQEWLRRLDARLENQGRHLGVHADRLDDLDRFRTAVDRNVRELLKGVGELDRRIHKLEDSDDAEGPTE